MRLLGKHIFILFNVLMICLSVSCESTTVGKEKATGKEKKYTSPSGYDLSKPIVIKLPLELDEISGVTYYPKDTSVFAIQDENGLLYKIFLNNPQDIQKWKYKKGADFEDVTLLDSIFYVLTSNGNITAVRFISEDSLQQSTYTFPFGKGNEFEILFYDASVRKLRLICKDCESDTKKVLTGYVFDPVSTEYAEDPVKIDVASIDRVINEKKIKFKPSAAAIHPVTKELYIISSVNKLLVIVDSNGQAKEVHRIDKGDFKQPEGLTFTPGGTMIISNEAADIGVANIMIFPYRSTNDTR